MSFGLHQQVGHNARLDLQHHSRFGLQHNDHLVAILIGLHALHLLSVVGISFEEVRIRSKDRRSIPTGGYVEKTGSHLLAVILAIATVIRVISTWYGKGD